MARKVEKKVKKKTSFIASVNPRCLHFYYVGCLNENRICRRHDEVGSSSLCPAHARLQVFRWISLFVDLISTFWVP